MPGAVDHRRDLGRQGRLPVLPGPLTERRRLGETFDRAARLYQRSRPDYPDALVERLLSVARLEPGDRVVEVGPGPGKATLPLARRGLRVTAVEPGSALADELRRNVTGLPVEVVTSRFEDWQADRAYDAVVSATAWHWVDPVIGYERAAQALRPGGHLAIWSATHVFPEDGDPFFSEIQQVYDDLGLSKPGDAVQPRPGELPDQRATLEASGHFRVVSVDQFAWTVAYDTEGYLDLLRTFSGHIAMDPADRDHLFGEVRRRIGQRPDGTVHRGWGSVLHVAERRS